MSATKIHATAIVDPSAEIGEGTEIGPYCLVGPGVRIGRDCRLDGHVTVAGPAVIGDRNRFFPHASIGEQTQDLKYDGEPTYLEVGDDNTFREFATVHRATAKGEKTVVGSRGSFLAYSHIAHDCIVGDDVIFSNNGTLAGHVEIGEFAVIGGLTAVHQFCRLGCHAITGGCSKIVQDVPPYMIADGNPAEVRGVNKVGLQRRGFSPEALRALREGYRILYRSKLSVSQALEEIDRSLDPLPEVARLREFIAASSRGIIR